MSVVTSAHYAADTKAAEQHADKPPRQSAIQAVTTYIFMHAL